MQRETMIRDVSGVRSRISWGAVFAGFFIALVSVVLLTSLGSAIGFTAARSNGVGTDQITTGAAIYGVIVTLFSLFVGGWATSHQRARRPHQAHSPGAQMSRGFPVRYAVHSSPIRSPPRQECWASVPRRM